MKRMFCIFLCLCLFSALLAGCTSTSEESPVIESSVESIAESSADSVLEQESSGETTAVSEGKPRYHSHDGMPVLDYETFCTVYGKICFNEMVYPSYSSCLNVYAYVWYVLEQFFGYTEQDMLFHFRVAILEEWDDGTLTDEQRQERADAFEEFMDGVIGGSYEKISDYTYHAELCYYDIQMLNGVGGYYLCECYCEQGMGGLPEDFFE